MRSARCSLATTRAARCSIRSASRLLVGAASVLALALTSYRLAIASAIVLDVKLFPSGLYRVSMSVAAVISAVLALALVRSSWTLAGAPLLALFLSAFGVGCAVESAAGGLLLRMPFSSAAWRSEQPLLDAVVGVATVLAVLWFQRFPARVRETDLTLEGLSGLRRLGTMWLAWSNRTWRVWMLFGLIPVGLSSAGNLGLPIDPTSIRLVAVLLAAWTGIGYLRIHLRRHHEDQRRRAAWVIEALTVALVFSAFAVVFEVQVHVLGRNSSAVVWPHAVMLPLALTSFVASLGVSVFYRGLVDPSLVVARTTILGVLGPSLTCVFLVGEELLSTVVVAWFGLPDLFGAVLTGLVAAALFAPLYRWANRLVDALRSGTAS